MRDRWRQFLVNAGKWGVVRTVVVLVLAFVGATILTLYSASYWPTLPGVALGFVIPYPARHVLVEHVEKVTRFHVHAGIGIALIAGVGRDYFKELGPIGLAVAFALFAVHIGTYFWVLSDPRIAVVRR